MRLTRKKKTLHAQQRDTPAIQHQRQAFREEVAVLDPRRLVFVDETGATTAMTRAYGRAPGASGSPGRCPAAGSRSR